MFEPGIHYGSVYDYFQLRGPRERPGSYSTLVPQDAFDFYFLPQPSLLRRLAPGDEETLADYDIQHVTYHQGMYAQGHVPGAWFGWQGLVDHGFSPVARGGRVTLFSRSGGPISPCRFPSRPVTSRDSARWKGRVMDERQAPFGSTRRAGSASPRPRTHPRRSGSTARSSTGPWSAAIDPEAELAGEQLACGRPRGPPPRDGAATGARAREPHPRPSTWLAAASGVRQDDDAGPGRRPSVEPLRVVRRYANAAVQRDRRGLTTGGLRFPGRSSSRTGARPCTGSERARLFFRKTEYFPRGRGEPAPTRGRVHHTRATRPWRTSSSTMTIEQDLDPRAPASCQRLRAARVGGGSLGHRSRIPSRTGETSPLLENDDGAAALRAEAPVDAAPGGRAPGFCCTASTVRGRRLTPGVDNGSAARTQAARAQAQPERQPSRLDWALEPVP